MNKLSKSLVALFLSLGFLGLVGCDMTGCLQDGAKDTSPGVDATNPDSCGYLSF
jgi:hypothetical protein